MAVREYVGARYVPKYAGAWDNTKTYEPLTIVTVENVGSYTSKKNVPAGVDITNTEYWVLSGFTNGAIIDLQEDVTEIRGDIADIKVDVGRLKDHKYLIFGDSYDVESIVGASWSAQVIERLGLDAQVISAGGAGFIGTGYPTWANLFSNATITDPEDITDVIILGGQNDNHETQAAILAAMEAFQALVLVTCPNIERWHIGYIGWRSNAEAADYVLNTSTRKAYYNNADSLGWAIIPNICYTLTDPRYFEDAYNYTHPNADGVAAIGNNLEQYLLTGYCDVSWNFSTTAALDNTVVTAYTGAETINVGCEFHNGILKTVFTNKALRCAQELSGNTDFTLATLNYLYNPFIKRQSATALIQKPIAAGGGLSAVMFGVTTDRKLYINPSMMSDVSLTENAVFTFIGLSIPFISYLD